MRSHAFLVSALLVTVALSCGGGGGCGGCQGFTKLPPGTFSGEKFDTAGSARLSAQGFSLLNANSSQILELFAPGNQLKVNVDCSIHPVTLLNIPALQLAIADTGTVGCTTEACGRLDGQCTPADVGHDLTIDISALSFAPKAPDVLEARVTATVKTGLLPVSEVRSSLLCLFNGRAKCTVDLDTTRTTPPTNDLAINIRLVVDPRWDRLITLEVSEVGGAKACGLGLNAPVCLDPADIIIANEGGCGACSTANFSVVKSLIVDQVAKSLTKQLNKALGSKVACAKCDAATRCPTSPNATATCDVDAGVCMDGAKCVPALLGVEGRLDVGTTLANFGAPTGAAVDVSIAAGGAVQANDAGVTLGLRGGAREVVVASCVKPLTRALPPALPLPDFDLDAPPAWDVGFSLSGQLLTEVLFRAQQSGALCLELGHETVAALESETLATLVPSLKKLAHDENVPLRVVIRPVNPPTASLGAGTLDAAGAIVDPLMRLEWKGLELDVYALLEDRNTRLFTLAADVTLPLGLRADGCSGVTPVIGSLMGAVTKVHVTNSELLAEPLGVLESLVPSLLTLAEPALAKGLSKFIVPDVQGFSVQLLTAKGVGRVAGSNTFNHLALYANLAPAGTMCTPTRKLAARAVQRAGASLALEVEPFARVSWRLNGGLWSEWVQADALGRVVISHPALVLDGDAQVELQSTDGRRALLEVR